MENLDTTEWEKMATRRELKIKGAIVVALLLPLVWVFIPDETTKAPGLMWFFVALFAALTGLLVWGLVRPAGMHPFIRVLKARRDEVTKSYAYEYYVNGRYSSSLLVMMLKNGKHVVVNVPRNEIPLWQNKLKSILPGIEHVNEVAPI